MSEKAASQKGSANPPGSQRGSQPGSQRGSQRGSQPGSPARGSTKPSGFPKGTGVDPARDPARQRPELSAAQLVGKRVDLPAEAFKTVCLLDLAARSGARKISKRIAADKSFQGKDETRFTARPGYNTQGKAVQMQLNIFQVLDWTDNDIYQYDVSL